MLVVVQLIHRLAQADISYTTTARLFFFPLLGKKLTKNTLGSAEENVINDAASTFKTRTNGCVEWVPRTTESNYVAIKGKVDVMSRLTQVNFTQVTYSEF